MTHARIDVRTEGVRVDPLAADEATVHGDAGIVEARRRFGGFDPAATLAGTAAAIGTAAVVAAAAHATSGVAYRLEGADGRAPGLGALIGGAVTLAVAFAVGGWVAGRISRYDGVVNGLGTVGWFVVLAIAAAAAGAEGGREFDIIDSLRLPQWFRDDATAPGALMSAAVGLIVVGGAAALAGRAGERWHRRADALIAHTRGGGIARLEGRAR